jgi:hydrogenase-4 component B
MELSITVSLIFTAIILHLTSGIPGLFLGRRSPAGQYLAALMAITGSLLGIWGAIQTLCGTATPYYELPWGLPLGHFSLQIDGLTAFFLIPIFLMGALGALYGLSYWNQSEHPENGRQLRFFYGALAGSMALVVMARDGVFFLFAWEAMALSAYFLITTEDQDEKVRQAGWIYLVATHAGSLCLFGLFALFYLATGHFAFQPFQPGTVAPWILTAIFFLSLIGFGFKAGLFPLHFWLPGAHANAPSHVSALMSGVMIKMGVYGILRVCWMIPNPPLSWGILILVLGTLSSLLGVLYALGQHDIKRLLAYHSIENIGIIFMGLGIALVGRSLAHPDLIILGMAGCLLHIWNHSLFKSLLFFGAGSVMHATGSRQIDRMGGLGKKMPYTSAFFILGAIAICGLPPLNGFISELFIYLGLFRTVLNGNETQPVSVCLGLAAPALAMTGALAVACFVKVSGIVFLGEPRTEKAAKAQESPITMIIPMAVLSAGCILIGLFPVFLAPVLDKIIPDCNLEMKGIHLPLMDMAPLSWITFMGIGLLVVIGIIFLWLRHRLPADKTPQTGTWDCGYAAPSARMEYTASSFAQMLVSQFGGILRPREHRPELKGLFPASTHFESHIEDSVLDRCLKPLTQRVQKKVHQFRWFHQGLVQPYIFYIIMTVLVLLALSTTAGDKLMAFILP